MTTTRTTRLLQLLAAVIYLLLLASGVRANDTALVQGAIDLVCMPGQSRTLDLRGQTYHVDEIIVAAGKHDGLKMMNGHIFGNPDSPAKRWYGAIALCKGIVWRGITYPNSSLNVTFEHVYFDGPWSNWTDDVWINRRRAIDQSANIAAINCMNGSRVDGLTVRGCWFRNWMVAVNSQYSIRVKIHDSHFDRVATQAIGSIAPPDNSVAVLHDIYRCRFDSCGSAFDFSGPEGQAHVTPPVVPRAVVRFSTILNCPGRNKVAGAWDFWFQRSTVKLDRPIPSQYSALNFPQCVSATIEDSILEGYVAGGINCNGWHPSARPTITVRRSVLRGPQQIAINSTGWTHLDSVTFDGQLYPWGDSAPPASQIDTVIANPVTVDTMARQYVGLRGIVRRMNRQHGTTHNPDTWFGYVAPVVRSKINELEAQAIEQ